MGILTKKKQTNVPRWLRIVIPVVLIAVWFGLGAFGGPYFGRVEEVSEVDLTAFLPESAEATKVADQLGKFRAESTLPGIVVFESETTITDASQDKLSSLSESLTNISDVTEASPPQLSDNDKAAIIAVSIDDEAEIPEVVSEVRSEAAEVADEGEMSSYVTGPAGFSADLNVAFSGIDGLLLGVALAVVFVILVFVYKSPFLPIVVLSTSVLALAGSILIVWQLANAGIVQLNGQVQGILFILVIGAATDYSLLYVARFREELYVQKDRLQATLATLKGSFEPILASGGTVIIGLLCLLLSDLASNKALGPVGSIGIAMAMLAALTYLPSVLLLTGRKVFWPIVPQATFFGRRKHKKKLASGVWHKVGAFVSAYPRKIWIAVSVVLLVFSVGVLQLKADGVAQDELIIGYSEAREGQDVLAEYFPDGAGSPAFIITPETEYQAVATLIESDSGVDGVAVASDDVPGGAIPLGTQADEIEQEIRERVGDEINAQRRSLEVQAEEIAIQAGPIAAEQFMLQARQQLPTVEALVEQANPFSDASPVIADDTVLLQATLADDPNSRAASATIDRLRTLARDNDYEVLIGGTTAAQLDTNTASIRDRAVIIPVVLAAITIVLMLLLRSILAPVLLLLTTVVSFGTALGVAALLFNHVWDFPGADPSVILYGFVFLVALGIDYNIFLMTRVREETLKLGTQKGVIKALVVTGGVITSAGIVLAATFAALAVIPILFLAQLAFIVSFGVLLDTIIVRSLLVPALIKDLGSVVWWPSKLVDKK